MSYDKLGIKEGYTNNKRARNVLAALQKCVIDQLVTKPVSDNILHSSNSNLRLEDQFKIQIRVDFFRPVLDCIKSSLESKFNTDCVKLIKNIPAVFPKLWNEEGIRNLANLARIDDEVCVV